MQIRSKCGKGRQARTKQCQNTIKNGRANGDKVKMRQKTVRSNADKVKMR